MHGLENGEGENYRKMYLLVLLGITAVFIRWAFGVMRLHPPAKKTENASERLSAEKQGAGSPRRLVRVPDSGETASDQRWRPEWQPTPNNSAVWQALSLAMRWG